MSINHLSVKGLLAAIGLALLAVCVTAAAGSLLSPNAFLLAAQSINSQTGTVTGFIDEVGADANGIFIRGWACQIGTDSTTPVHLYAGGSAGQGTLIAGIGRTNIESAVGIHSICGTSNEITHRYKYYFSQRDLERFAGQTIYAHGISQTGKPNKQLNNSGQFQLPTQVPATLTAGHGSITGFIDETGVDQWGSYVRGWACQIGIDQAIDVHFYAGGPAGNGTFIGNVEATDVESAQGIHNICLTDDAIPHRYRFYLDAADARAFAAQEIHAYGFSSDQVTAPSTKLNNSGSFTLPTTFEPISGSEFNIFWHLGMNVTDLADLSPSDPEHEIIDTVQSMIDGYYFLLPDNATANSYWPRGVNERPFRCNTTAIANQRPTQLTIGGVTYDSQAIVNECQNLLDQNLMYQGISPTELESAHNTLYEDAYARMVANLDIATEQVNGKVVMTEMLLTSQDFNYDEGADNLSLVSDPRTYDFIRDLGLEVDSVMAYQEPRSQSEAAILKVPNPTNPENEYLPANLRIIPILGDAFARANDPLSWFAPNYREWFPGQYAPEILDLIDTGLPAIDGFFFEGGTQVLEQNSIVFPERGRVESLAIGLAWLLQHTDRPIYLLMPGYWPGDELNTQADRDQITYRLMDYVMELNAAVNDELGLPSGQNSFCNDRITLIPAGYGGPFHLEPLPVSRDGRMAGTVTGQIATLSVLKGQMCGQ